MAMADSKNLPVNETSPMEPEINPENRGNGFADNIEHLEALEYLSRLRLARAYLLAGDSPHASPTPPYAIPVHMKNRKDRIGHPDLSFLNISKGELSLDEINTWIRQQEKQLRQKTKTSIERGIHLYFEDFCISHKLDSFERTVLSLILANNTCKAFRDFYEKSLLDPHDRQDGGMSIGTILSIIHPDYRDQITHRRYFSIAASLIRHEVLVPHYSYDETTNILDVYVHLHERILRYLLGDNNVYDINLQCISRYRSTIDLEQVIISDKVKKDVLHLAQNYSKNRSKKTNVWLDNFYGYGTGLIFLFHGPSGTGKTMLAHALATSLDKELLSVNIEFAANTRTSSEDLIKYLFKEAKLSDGIVFFDECDEIFQVNSRESRTLLIEIEKASCITIMATNRVVNLDPALDRRITMKVPFFLPDESQREKIWKAMVPNDVSLDKDVDFKSLASKYVFTGGLIKNAMFTAITNAVPNKGNSKVTLKASEIEGAAEWQSASMFDLCSYGRTYDPQTSMDKLSLRPQDRVRFQELTEICAQINDQSNGLRLLLGCSDLDTGMAVAEAVAKNCDFKIREFQLSDLLAATDGANKIMDPMTFTEVGLVDYAFRRATGRRALTLLVDPESWFERFFLEEPDNGTTRKDVMGFYRKLGQSRGLLFLVTAPIKNKALPFEFNHYFEVQPPPEELQLRKWETHFGNDKETRKKLVKLVEDHPLHLNQISQVIEAAKTTAFFRENKAVTLGDVQEAIVRLKNLKRVPILFGQEDHKKTGFMNPI